MNPYVVTVMSWLASFLLLPTQVQAQAHSCYARAMPTRGHGGQAWASNRSVAEGFALDFCRKNASQTGGTPNTCKIVESHCNSKLLDKRFSEVARPIKDSAEVYSATVSNITPAEVLAHSQQLTIGTAHTKEVIDIAWKAGKDENDCWRVLEVKMSRQQPDRAITITHTGHRALPYCMSVQEQVYFQSVSLTLDYTVRAGLKTHEFRGGIALIQGDGGFMDTRPAR